MDVGELERDAICDLGLLAASRHEQEVLCRLSKNRNAGGHIRLRLTAPCADRVAAASRFAGAARGPAHRQIGSDLSSVSVVILAPSRSRETVFRR